MKQNEKKENEKTGRQKGAAENSTVKDDMDAYDYLGSSCSATDCTGLMPAPPRNRAEREAYEELYPYQAEAYPKE